MYITLLTHNRSTLLNYENLTTATLSHLYTTSQIILTQKRCQYDKQGSLFVGSMLSVGGGGV